MNLSSGKDILLLAGSLAIPLIIGGIGGWVTTRALPVWYAGLRKPKWNPPNAIFGPVWTLLYILMGVAVWQVLRLGWEAPGVQLAAGLFGLQLALNLLWSVLFFGRRAPGPAAAEIIVLLAMVWATAAAFFSLSPLAGWLLVPYGLWTTFATGLNLTVWRLNRFASNRAG